MSARKAKLRGLWTVMHGDRRRFAVAMTAMLFAAILLYLVPLIPQAVIDGALSDAPEKAGRLTTFVVEMLGGHEYVRTHLWIALVAIAIVAVLAGSLVYLRQRFSAIAAQNTARRLRNEVYDHIQGLPCSTLDHQQSGDLLQRCTSDVDTAQKFLQTQVVEVGRAIIMLLVPLPIMFAMDWRMTIAGIWAQPIVVVFALIYFGRVRHVFREKDEAEGRLTSTVNENLAGIRVVRAFNRQEFEVDRFRERNDEHRRLDERLYRVFANFWSLSDLVCFSQQASVIFVGAWLLYNGTIEVGQFYFFFAAVGMFLWPVRMMGRILAELGKATVAVERLQEILALPLEPDPEDPIIPERMGGDIRFNEVVFSHGESSPVLNSASFQVAEGETVALVGPSGSGKSTIANLLMRFYDPDGGRIQVGGIDLDRIPRRTVREQIATVMQQPFLFSRSIRENVALGVSSIDEADIEHATGMACMHDSITTFQHGYGTMVGERGVTLSGGQRQRIAIAQALLQDPSILILDDALSAVDTRTEHLILRALRERHGRHTTVIIAHRLSTLKEADRILVLEDGRIAQEGTHESLKDKPGLYRRLWEIQSADDATTAEGGDS
ncbi:MAG: ABC transporter ATP-binding protein/permease [Phycisphaerales bacterium]|nr:ABC transporter ATP-binding protein/permease [Phycisphaerales bacterium]